MRLKEKVFAAIAVLGVSAMTCVPVFAGTVNVNLKANQAWSNKYSVSRTGNYSYVSARCKSVYPSSGEDNFKYIQTRIVNSSGTLLMDDDYVKLNEEDANATHIYIKNGYLNISTVNFEFRGNTDKAASAVVGIDGN